MNFYGETSGPEHQLFGRIAPVCEALHRAILRGAGKPVQPLALSNGIPEWCHNIADRLVLTILKGVAGSAPKSEFDARCYGRIIGGILRGIVHFSKEVPAKLKQEGLLELTPEQDKKVESMIDTSAIISFASEKFGRPIADQDELLSVAGDELEKKIKQQFTAFMAVGRYLLDRPVREQHEFLCGVPEGFTTFLNNDGGFTGQRQRTGLYLLLLGFWPEITEMQRVEPPKTCKFLLDWLEKQEGKQLVEDERQFNGLCSEIGLVMAPPGHPHKSPST